MRISPEVEIAFALATREAQKRRHEYVTVEHLLYALLFDAETADVLKNAGGDVAALKKRLGREVRLAVEIDEALLGGAVIRAGDIVIDGSVRSRLDRLSNALVA